jgi:hypothetical protein
MLIMKKFRIGFMENTLLQPLKNTGSEIGSFKYDLIKFDLKPFGASFVILTPKNKRVI